jgi:hypothetical protein
MAVARPTGAHWAAFGDITTLGRYPGDVVAGRHTHPIVRSSVPAIRPWRISPSVGVLAGNWHGARVEAPVAARNRPLGVRTLDPCR